MSARLALRAAAALAAATLAASCTFGETVIAPTAPTLVVHSVLNPTVSRVEVLLEETLTGRVRIDTTRAFDPQDPIATAGGIPVGGATVWIVRLSAPIDSMRLTERLVATTIGNRSTGVYEAFFGTPDLPPAPARPVSLEPGARYGLRIRTVDGRVVTGETRIPGPVAGWTPAGALQVIRDTLDRSSDTLRLTWPNVPGARTAGVRVDTPLGPWFLFNDSTSFAFVGGLRNFFQGGLPSVFQPGHVQTVSIAVVDTGFYDYYRSGNDPFGGAGIINKLRGGIGLFAGTLPMLRRRIAVTQPATTPLDASWVSATNDSLVLWLETAAQQVSSVSGYASVRGTTPTQFSGIGTLRDNQLRFVVKADERPDTSGVFVGRVSGDSIVGAWQPGFPLSVVAPSRSYRRAGPPRPRPAF